MLLGLLLAMIMYCIFMYFIVFKTYICIDIKNNKIVIRKFPGYKKEELSLYELVDIKVSDGLPAEFKDFFTIDIKFKGYTKQITSWSVGPGSLPLTGSYRKQRKRLEKFCDECNKYLKNRLQNDFIDSNL